MLSFDASKSVALHFGSFYHLIKVCYDDGVVGANLLQQTGQRRRDRLREAQGRALINANRLACQISSLYVLTSVIKKTAIQQNLMKYSGTMNA